MKIEAAPAGAREVLPLREEFRREMDCQVVHDSIHRRPGWTETYLFTVNGQAAAFGSKAIGGPWKDKPTIFEFFVRPEYRPRAFDLFESLLTASGAQFMEIQSNDAILAVMLHTYARDIWTEKIVFREGSTTSLPSPGGVIQCVTSDEETRAAIEGCQGGPEWRLEIDGVPAATGGILFHYNRPYGDIYMDVTEPFRGRGVGSYLVQELKRFAYELGARPAARCSPENIASRKTLTKAGFVPFANILNGTIVPTATSAPPAP